MATAFSGILGQDNALGIIRAYLDNGGWGGGYIFSGPDSVGKKMTAKLLACALNCDGNNNQACLLCPSCLKIERNQHPDVHIISSDEAQVKIEQVRQLAKDLKLSISEEANSACTSLSNFAEFIAC